MNHKRPMTAEGTTFKHRLICLAVASAFGGVVHANPTGPAVVSGQAAFSQQGNTLAITNSPNAIINWQSFSIGATEATRFIQQSASSAVLNRVIGVDPSVILGTLQSNGKVFLINPSGVLFGQGSRIDVAGLVASTLNMSDQDFLAGRLNFTAGSITAGGLTNRGNITTPSGGSVILVAPQIENSGIINAPNGDVILAAGHSVRLGDTGAPNVLVEIQAPDTQAVNVGEIIVGGGSASIYAGLIQQKGIVRADSASMDAAGRIVFKATKDVTLAAGSTTSASGATGGDILIQAQTGTNLVYGDVSVTGAAGKGGGIQLLGTQVGVIGNAVVNASGALGGGVILVGGDYKGGNLDVQNARATYFGAGASLTSDATVSGDGGRIVLWSDDVTRAYGSIGAKGGATSGNGGFVETSSKGYLEVTRAPDLRAPKGIGGTWLLDPADVLIADNDLLCTDIGTFCSVTGTDPLTFASDGQNTTGSPSVISNLLISNALNLGTSVIVTTSVGPDLSPSQAGNITVDAAITKTAGGDAALSLQAHNNIYLTSNANVTSTVGELSVILNADQDSSGGGAVSLNGASIITNGGSLLIGGGTNPLTGFATSAGDLNSGVSLFNSTISTGAGNIIIRGATNASPGQFGDGVTIDGNTSVQTTTGNVTIRGDAAARSGTVNFSAGVKVQGTAGIASETGTILIDGLGAGTLGSPATSQTYGVAVQSDARVEVTGAGRIELLGNAGTSSFATGGVEGVTLLQRAQILADSGGTIAMTGSPGTPASGGAVQNGVGLNSDGSNPGVVVRAGGAGGSITITGLPATGTAVGYNANGVVMQGPGTLVQATGTATITINGTGSDTSITNGSAGTHGLLMFGGAQIRSDAGAITITGTAGLATNTARDATGIAMFDAGTAITTVDGAIQITGTGGGTLANPSGQGAHGVMIGNGAVIEATGTGSVNITGTAGVVAGIFNPDFGRFTNGAFAAYSDGVQVFGGGQVKTNSGSLTIVGNGNAVLNDALGTDGVFILNAGSAVRSTSGNISVTGTGGGTAGGRSGGDTFGVFLFDNATVSAGGAGTVRLEGTGGATSGGVSIGVEVYNNSQVIAQDGGITLTGTGGQSTNIFTGRDSFANHGVELGSDTGSVNSSSVRTTGNGSILIQGVAGNAAGGGNGGVVLRDNSVVASGGTGSVTLDGTLTTADYDDVASIIVGNGRNGGVFISALSTVRSGVGLTSGGGGITITGRGPLDGTGASSTPQLFGVRIADGSLVESVAGGAITISGDVGDARTAGLEGVGILSSTVSGGSANISITGVGAGASSGAYGVLIAAGGVQTAGDVNINFVDGLTQNGGQILAGSLQLIGTGNAVLNSRSNSIPSVWGDVEGDLWIASYRPLALGPAGNTLQVTGNLRAESVAGSGRVDPACVGDSCIIVHGSIFAGGAISLYSNDIYIAPPTDPFPGTVATALGDPLVNYVMWVPWTPGTTVTLDDLANVGSFIQSPRLIFGDPGNLGAIGTLEWTASIATPAELGPIQKIEAYATDINFAAALGNFGTGPLPLSLQFEAAAGINIGTGPGGATIYLGDNQNLFLAAGYAPIGDLTVGGAGATTLKVGETAANTGYMWLLGRSIHAVAAGAGDTNLLVSGTGNQALQSDSATFIESFAGGNVFVRADDGTQRLTTNVSLPSPTPALTISSESATTGGVYVSTVSGEQVITVAGGVLVTSGAGATAAASIHSGGNQTVDAGWVRLWSTGGSSAADLFAEGNQSITTTDVGPAGWGIALVNTGSSANTFLGTNGAQVLNVRDSSGVAVGGGSIGRSSIYAGLSQNITVEGASGPNLVLISADRGETGIGSGGNQTIVAGQAGQSGGIVVLGGVGAGAGAYLASNNLDQTIRTSGDILMQAGTANGAYANIGSGANQSIQASGNLQIVGGMVSGTDRASAVIYANADQTITANSITITTPAGPVSSGIFLPSGDQTIGTTGSAANGYGITIENTGARGPDQVGVDSTAFIVDRIGNQTIDVSNSNGILISASGGDAAGIFGEGLSQSVTIHGSSSSNELVIAGGAGMAQLFSNGPQTIVAGLTGQPGGISIHGGTQDGAIGRIYDASGTQSIATTGNLSLTGGTAPAIAPFNLDQLDCLPACASLHSQAGLQTIDAGSILLKGGASGSENLASIRSNAGQAITIRGPGGLTLIGGGEAGTTSDHNNFAILENYAGAQSINFLTAGASLLIDAGDTGLRHFAGVYQAGIDGSGQTINGAPAITIAGGTGGNGAAGPDRFSFSSNLAFIASESGAQRINAQSIDLIAGASNFNVADIANQGGDLAGSVTGSQTISVTGAINVTGGSAADAFARVYSRSGAQTISAGSLTLLESGAGQVLIGNVFDPALASVAPGSTSVQTLSGNISIGSGSIRSDSVALNSSGAVTQLASGEISSGALTVSASTGIHLLGGNIVNAFSAENTGSGNLDVNMLSRTISPSGNVLATRVVNGGGDVNLTIDGTFPIVYGLSSGAAIYSASGAFNVDRAEMFAATVASVGAHFGSLSVVGGTNTLNTGATVIDGLTLSSTLSPATLTGSSTFSVANQFAWYGGVIANAGGITTNGSTSILRLHPVTLAAVDAVLDTNWTNSATGNVQYDGDGGGNLIINAGRTVTNVGQFHINPVGAATGQIQGAGATFVNQGLLAKDRAVPTQMDTHVVNDGGTIASDAGTFIITDLTLQGAGLLQGAAPIVVPGSFDWSGGTIAAGVELDANGSGSISTGVAKALDGTLSNGGTLSFLDNVSGTGILRNTNQMEVASVVIAPAVINDGLVTILPGTGTTFGSTLTNSTGATVSLISNSTTLARLIVTGDVTNDGLINLQAGGAGTTSAGFGVTTGTLTNNGTIQSVGNSGTAFNRLSGNLVNNGTLEVADSLRMDNAGTTFTNAGSGSVTIAAGETLFVNGDVAGAVLNLDNGLSVGAGATLRLAHVAANGPGVISNLGTLDISANTDIAGNVANGLGGQVSVHSLGNSIGSLSNSGTVSVLGDAGLASLDVGTGFTNTGTIKVLTGGATDGATLSVSGVLRNTGVLLSDSIGGLGNNAIDATITNLGTIDAVYNLTILNAGKTLDTAAGTLRVGGGTFLDINQGAVTFGTGTTFSGLGGNIRLSGGTLNLVSDTAFIPNGALLELRTETVNGPGKFTNQGGNISVFGTDNLFNAALDNRGGIIVQPGGSLLLGGGTQKINQVAGVLEALANNLGSPGYSSITVASGTTLDNLGGLALVSDAASGYNASLIIGGTVNNSGLIYSSLAGTGSSTPTSFINPGGTSGSLVNTGMIQANSPLTVALTTLDTSAGTLSLGAGQTLNIAGTGTTIMGGGTTFLGDGTGIVDVTGAGTLRLAGSMNMPTAANLQFSGNVAITSAALVTLTSGGTLSLANDSLDSGVTLLNRGSLTLDATGGSGRLDNEGTVSVFNTNTLGALSQSSTAVLTLQGSVAEARLSVADQVRNSGLIVLDAQANGATLTAEGGLINQGSVKGIGTIVVGTHAAETDFRNEGTIAPGASPGTLSIEGDLTLTSSSVLDIELAGLLPGTEHDFINVSGNALLDGTVNVLLVSPYAPAGGSQYQVLNAATVSGTFAAINSPPGFTFNGLYGATSFTLDLAALLTNFWLPLTGDWDNGLNWSLGHAPTAAEDAIIDVTGGLATVTFRPGTTAHVASVVVNGEVLDIFNSVLDIGSFASFDATAVVNVTNSSITGLGTINNSGVMNLGTASIANPLNNLGTVSAGGTNNLTGEFASAAGSTLRIVSGGLVNIADAFVNNGLIELQRSGATSAQLIIVSPTVLSNPGTVLSSGTGTVANVLQAGLNNTGLIDAASDLTISGSLTIPNDASGTVVTGAGNLSVGGSFSVNANNVLNQPILGGTGILTTNGASTVSGSQLHLDTRSWNNLGAMTVSGRITLDNGAALTNETGGALVLTGTIASPLVAGGVGAAPVVHNLGTLTKTGTAAQSLSVVFDNDGVVNVDTQTLTFSGNGTHTGSFVAGGGIVDFAGGTQTFNLGSSLSGTAEVRFTGATANFAAATGISAPVRVNGGTIGGIGGLTLNGVVTIGGGTFTGTGLLITNNATTVNNGSAVLDGRAWNNFGAMTVNGRINLDNGASLTNEVVGTVTLSAINTNATPILARAGGGSFLNQGVFTKNNAIAQQTVDAAFDNAGIVRVNGGTLQLPRDGSHSGVFDMTAPGTSLAFTSGIHTLGAGTAFTGPGGVRVAGATVDVNAIPVNASNVVMQSGTLTGAGALSISDSFIYVGGNMTGTGRTILGSAITFAPTTFTVDRSLQVDGTLIHASGVLTVNAGKALDVTNTLNLSGGTLTGAGDVAVGPAGTLAWSGGIVTGSGAFTSDGATILDGAAKTLDGRVFDTNGPVTWNGTGLLTLANGATFNNNGSMVVSDDFQIANGAGVNAFVNNGTLAKSGGTGTGFIATLFENAGTVNVDAGKLSLNGGGTSSGTFNVASGAILEFGTGSHVLDAASTVAGTGDLAVISGATLTQSGAYSLAGSIDVTGTGNASFAANTAMNPSSVSVTTGTLSFDGTLPVSTGLLANVGGTLGGTASINAGALNWFGGTIQGTGALTVSGVTNLNGGAKTLTSRRLDANGAVDWDGTGLLTLANGATFNNNAAMIAGGDFTIFDGGGTGANAFNNNGTLTKSGGTLLSRITTPFSNNGAVVVNSGSFRLENGGTDSGSYDVSTGAQLLFRGGPRTITGPVTGAGSVGFESGTVDVGGSYALSGSTNVAGAVVNFNAAASTGALSVTSGTLGGTGDVTVSGAFNWTAGAITGSGNQLITDGTSTLGGTTKTLDGRIWTNNGSAIWNGAGTLQVTNNSTLVNAGTFTVSGAGNIDALAGTNTISNLGTFIKTGTGTAVVFGTTAPLTFDNGPAGLIDVQGGTLQIPGGSLGGTLGVATGAQLRLEGGTNQFTDGSLITGAGALTFVPGFGGSISFTGTSSGTTVDSGMTLNLGGVTGGTGNINNLGTLDLNSATLGGAINNNGTLSITNGSTIGGGIDNAGNLTVTSSSIGGNLDNSGTATVNNSTVSGALINTGTMSVNASSGSLGLIYANAGSFTVTAGTVVLGSNNTNGGGSFSVAPGATLDFAGGTYTATAVNGAGTGKVNVSGGNVNAGLYSVPGETSLTAGSLSLSGTAALGTLNQNGGFLNIGGTATIDTLNLVSGFIGGGSSSGLTVNAFSGNLFGLSNLWGDLSLTLTDTAVVSVPGFTVTNALTLRAPAGSLEVLDEVMSASNVVLSAGTAIDITDFAEVNGGTITLSAPSVTVADALVGSAATTNVTVNAAGTFIVSGTFNDAKLTATGTIDVRSGNIQVLADGASASIDPATLNLSATGTLTILGGTRSGASATVAADAINITASNIVIGGGTADGAYAGILGGTGSTNVAAVNGLTLTPGSGLIDADAVIGSSAGSLTISAASCVGCTVLNASPVGNLATDTGLYGTSVTLIVPNGLPAIEIDNSIIYAATLAESGGKANTSYSDEEDNGENQDAKEEGGNDGKPKRRLPICM